MNTLHIEACLLRIRRVSTAVRLLCKLAYGVTLCVFVVATGHTLYHQQLGGGPESSSFVTYVLPRLLMLAGATGWVLLLTWLVDQLFACFQRGEVFERGTLRRFRILSWIILFSGLVTLNVDLNSAAVNVNLFAGQFWVGLILVFISWILEIGAEIQEENKATI